jgi:hypothetical protein
MRATDLVLDALDRAEPPLPTMTATPAARTTNTAGIAAI